MILRVFTSAFFVIFKKIFISKLNAALTQDGAAYVVKISLLGGWL
jgi:hypothetical protein